MNASRLALPVIAGALLALSGCQANDTAVSLSQQTQAATMKVRDAYLSDLRAIRATEQSRLRLLESPQQRYLIAHHQLEELLQKAFDAKLAALEGELINAFDEEAFKLMSQEFWLHIDRHPEVSDLNLQLKSKRENMIARCVEAEMYPNDNDARSRQVLAYRQYLRAETQAFAFYRTSFARLSSLIASARVDFVQQVHTTLAQKKLTLPPPNPAATREAGAIAKNASAENVATVDERIKSVTDAMQGISDAQTIITTFLQDSGPINQATVNGFISGFIGLKSPNDDSGNPLGLPEFTDQLLGAFQSKFTESVTALEGEKFKLFKELGKALKTTLKESGVDTTNTGAADDGAAMENPADATTGD